MKGKLWAVRQRREHYLLFVGNTPKKPKHGWRAGTKGYLAFVSAEKFHEAFPEHRLPWGGGPVEIKFEVAT